MKHLLYILIFTIGLSFAGVSQNRMSLGAAFTNAPKYMKFYPNPATSYIYFDMQNVNSQNYSLLIFNFSGKKVFEMKNLPSKFNINLQDFYRGLYIYQLREKSGAIIESGKFQVIK